ncbi:MAG: DUF58 domain-containing protein, partial [Verrucomicrobiota bacterium]
MRIKSLELRARTIVEGFLQGLHRSPYHGSSVEFAEYREYVPGDDTRFIDWKLYARSDRHCIKKFEAETNLHCHLALDLSRSMGFKSIDHSKADYAVTLAATFTHFLFGQGDAVGLVSFDSTLRDYYPSQRRVDQLRTLLGILEKPPEGEDTDLKASFKAIAPLFKKRGLVVIFSDLLAPLEGLQSELGFLRSCGHEVALFHIMDPGEMDLDFTPASRFKDLETGQIIYIDPAAARESYLEKMGAHLEQVETLCKGLGIDSIRTATDSPFDQPLYDL